MGEYMFGFNIYRSRFNGTTWSPYVKLNRDEFYGRPPIFIDSNYRTIEVLSVVAGDYVLSINGTDFTYTNTDASLTVNALAVLIGSAIHADFPTITVTVGTSSPSGIMSLTSDAGFTPDTSDTKMQMGTLIGETLEQNCRYIWRVTQVMNGVESVLSGGVESVLRATMNSSFSSSDIFEALEAWAYLVVGSNASVVRAKDPGPRPSKPYLTIDLSAPEMIGQDDERRIVLTGDAIVGPRKFTAIVDVWSPDQEGAFDISNALISGLQGSHPAKKPLESIKASTGIIQPAQDLSQCVGAEWEYRIRLQFDLYASSVAVYDRGRIERVELAVTLGDNLHSTVVVVKPTA
jgi:hypothetical protein